MTTMTMASSSESAPPRRSGGGSILIQYFLFILTGFGMMMVWLNSKHEGINPIQASQNQQFSVASFTERRKPPILQDEEDEMQDEEEDTNEGDSEAHSNAKSAQAESEPEEEDPSQAEQAEVNGRTHAQLQPEAEKGHTLAGLDCSKHGGPPNEVAAEMVYWSDIPSDNAHISPFYSADTFLTFEPDHGGWNNIRMSMETVLAMAVAMGRTLVLPPEQGMYLLENAKGAKGSQRKHFSFNDFYHLESIASEHGGLNIITMDQFLQQEAMTGKLKDSSGKAVFPPGNRTDWNGSNRKTLGPLHNYLRTVSHSPSWNPEKCLAAFPASTDPKDLRELEALKTKIEQSEWDQKLMGPNGYKEFIGKPGPVDASTEDRAKENWAERKTLCIYGEELQKSPLVHFGFDYGGAGARLLVHFYAFVFHQDWKHDLWLKRFVRDHVRYVDEIQCAAARVVHAVHERARKHDPSSNGDFDAFHIRRGDFQFKETRFDADKIYAVTKGELKPNSTIYIGTDERDKSFFKPLADHYDLVFLDDFMHLVEDVNSNFYGMLDQLIASRSRVFFGCWFSTFTGHINRIRGYHSVKKHLPGYEDGALPTTYYYALEDRKLHMHQFYPVKKSFYAREFPTAWRGIDKSIGELGTSKS